jgi:hypothetical protein
MIAVEDSSRAAVEELLNKHNMPSQSFGKFYPADKVLITVK